MLERNGSVQESVEQLLAGTKDRLTEAGVVDLLQDLAQDVWAMCVNRYEPDELGDTHMSLGIQAVENFKSRAQRRYLGDDREAPEKHWDVQGLTLETPRNVLTLLMPGLRLMAMKTPMAEGRSPRLDLLADWGDQSHARNQIALENTQAMGGWLAPARGQDELFKVGSAPLAVPNYLLLWSGDPDGPLTAGRLAVPVMGEQPFAAVTDLWWDVANVDAPSYDRSSRIDGPGFDERPVTKPALSLKPSVAGEEQA
ncbi:hypothetical protein [Nocardioides panacihumi]